jgi:(p)ppGpp synthase/HD superfamily hydrolase
MKISVKEARKRKAKLLERAIEIAVAAHAGQCDKNGDPYILHPLRMMTRARTMEEKIVAVLHDVVEDSAWTLTQLRAEDFPREVIRAVGCLTKKEGEEYDVFVERAISHPLAKAVKILDLEDNMNVMRLKEVDGKAAKRLAKYLRAWRHITQGLG